MRIKNFVLTGALFVSSSLVIGQSITITNTQTPADLVNNVLVGSGVAVSNIEYNNSVPAGTVIQPTVGYFNAGTTSFPIQEGLILATGNVTVALGPNTSPSASGTITDPFLTDADLDAICAAGTNNEAILEFDFVPTGNIVEFKYIFASEEYPEWSPSSYNDAFGFFLSGPGLSGIYTGGAVNLAQLPSPSIPVTINNVNPTTNAAYYVSNAGGTAIQFDGHTVILTATANVQCGETYHIKLAICDAGDQIYDSAVFLEANSFSSNGVDVQIASATGSAAITEACDSAIVTFIRPEDEVTTALTIDYGIGGTATNGTDYPTLPGTITFPIGVDTVQFYITPSTDGFAEGTETVILSVDIVNSCGDTITTEAIIEIIDPLPFNVVPGDIIIDCPTATVDISATTDGGVPGFTYDWETGATTPTISVPGDVVGVTSFDVDITDECGTTASGTVTVTLNPAPEPTITFNNNTFTICPDDDVTIVATVNNPYGAVTYDWNPGTGTTNTYTVSPNVLTWYYLTINDECYDVIDSVKVEIGSIDLTDLNVTDATNCPGQPGVPGSLDVLPNDPTFTYTLTGGGDVFGPQASGTFPNLDGGIIYFLHVEDDMGCTIDTTVSIGLGANAVIATWNPGALQDVTCFGDGNGAASISNVIGGITAPYDVTWTHTTGLHDQTTVNMGGGDAINDLFGGNWVVTVTDQEGCAWSHLFNIFEPAELTLNFISNTPSCYLFTDGSVTASTTGGNGGNVFTMTNSAGTQLNLGNSNTINQLGEGWYYTTIVDAEGCNVEDSIFIDAPDEMAIDMTIDQPLCYGVESGLATVDTVYNHEGPYSGISYYWNPNPSGNNGLGQVTSNHMGPGDYTLTINDANGCSKVFDFTIVYPDELVFTEIGMHPAYCRLFNYQSGNGVVYAAAGGGTPDYTYQWVNLNTGATTTNTTWGGLNPGQYQMTVTDDNGCQLIQVVDLDSLNPIAAFDAQSPQFLTAGLLEGTAAPEVCVTFTNQSQNYANPFDPNADTTFFWNLNTPVDLWQISHDFSQQFDTCYADSGLYRVCLVALNKNGCSDTTCQDIIVHNALEFEPINIFSPDGDGINDGFTFFHHSQAVNVFHCTIVNRWGTTMYEMDHISDSWDGTDPNGDPCSDGVYFYVYNGISTDGTAFAGQGTVQIINSNQ